MFKTILEEERDQGRSEGELLAARKHLRMLLEEKFGNLPDPVVQQINTSTDLGRLEAALRQVHRLGRLEDLQL